MSNFCIHKTFLKLSGKLDFFAQMERSRRVNGGSVIILLILPNSYSKQRYELGRTPIFLKYFRWFCTPIWSDPCSKMSATLDHYDIIGFGGPKLSNFVIFFDRFLKCDRAIFYHRAPSKRVGCSVWSSDKETMKYQVKSKVRLKNISFFREFWCLQSRKRSKIIFVHAREMIYDVSKIFKKSKICESKISPEWFDDLVEKFSTFLVLWCSKAFLYKTAELSYQASNFARRWKTWNHSGENFLLVRNFDKNQFLWPKHNSWACTNLPIFFSCSGISHRSSKTSENTWIFKQNECVVMISLVRTL